MGKPPCAECRAIYERKNERPPCATCTPKLWPDNEQSLTVVRMCIEGGVRDAQGVIAIMGFVGIHGDVEFRRIVAALSEVVSMLDDAEKEGSPL